MQHNAQFIYGYNKGLYDLLAKVQAEGIKSLNVTKLKEMIMNLTAESIGVPLPQAPPKETKPRTRKAKQVEETPAEVEEVPAEEEEHEQLPDPEALDNLKWDEGTNEEEDAPPPPPKPASVEDGTRLRPAPKGKGKKSK